MTNRILFILFKFSLREILINIEKNVIYLSQNIINWNFYFQYKKKKKTLEKKKVTITSSIMD